MCRLTAISGWQHEKVPPILAFLANSNSIIKNKKKQKQKEKLGPSVQTVPVRFCRRTDWNGQSRQRTVATKPQRHIDCHVFIVIFIFEHDHPEEAISNAKG
jgi:hypothetical protein